VSLPEAPPSARAVMDDVPGARPYIDEAGILVVPADCEPRHRWWTREGMKLSALLTELHVSRSVWERYLPDPYPEELQRENYPLLEG